MSSDFNFTVTSCFLGNDRVKPYFKIQCPPIPTALYSRNALVERLLFLPKGSSSPFPPFTPLFLLPFVKCQENYPENLRKYSFAKFAAFKIISWGHGGKKTFILSCVVIFIYISVLFLCFWTFDFRTKWKLWKCWSFSGSRYIKFRNSEKAIIFFLKSPNFHES